MSRAAWRPSAPGILTSRITRSGLCVRDQLDGIVAAAGLPYDVVALVEQDLLQIQPDDRLVLGDDHTPAHGVSSLLATVMGAPGCEYGIVAPGCRRQALGCPPVTTGSAGAARSVVAPSHILPDGGPQPGPTTRRSSRSSWRRSSSAIWSTSAWRVRMHGRRLPADLVVLLGGDRGLGHQGPQAGVVGHLVDHHELLVEDGQLAPGADQPLMGVLQASLDGGPVHGRAILRTTGSGSYRNCGLNPRNRHRSTGLASGVRRPA